MTTINLNEKNTNERENKTPFQKDNFKSIKEELEKDRECKKIFHNILLEYESILIELTEEKKKVIQQEIEIDTLEKNEDKIKKILNKICKEDLGYSYNQLANVKPTIFKRGIIEDWSIINKLKKRKLEKRQ